MSVRLMDVVEGPEYLYVVNIGTMSDRQFRKVMEGACPQCESDLLERIELGGKPWAVCLDCTWAVAFCAVAAKTANIVWRLLPAGNEGADA